MKRSCLALLLGLLMQNSMAAFIQSTTEAERVAGGTTIGDANASGGQAVTRASDGVYTWWVSDTSALERGSYSVYARIALAPGVSGSRNFGLYALYNEVSLGITNTTIANRAWQWVRVGGFELTQTGAPLRLSDWSSGGISVDKLAFVKDVAVEAEAVAGGSVIVDTAASGGKAVTQPIAAGAYAWWVPSAAELRPGDYTVYASLASTDQAPHNFGMHVVQGSEEHTFDLAVASSGYQWYKLNDFVQLYNAPALRISDYSAPKLKLDRIKLVRANPYSSACATVPEPRLAVDSWRERFGALQAFATNGNVGVLFMGDSITEQWKDYPAWGSSSSQYPWGNFGIGGDHTGNVLWRLQNGGMENLRPKVVVLMIGVNNLRVCGESPAQVFEGVKATVARLRQMYPDARILLNAVLPYEELPTHPSRQAVTTLNAQIATLADGNRVVVRDYGSVFLENGKIRQDRMTDFLHPSGAGYAALRQAMLPTIEELLK